MVKSINLTELDYIGKGLHRKCYVHPEDHNKCIKINYNQGAEAETQREIAYYRHLIKRKINWQALPRYYGAVMTNFGAGQVFELIRDADGAISLSLEHYLADPTVLPQTLLPALASLRQALFADRIISMTIKSKNILWQKQVEGDRLVIIDNIGNAALIPLDNYCGWLAKYKIERRWRRFLLALQQENPALDLSLCRTEPD